MSSSILISRGQIIVDGLPFSPGVAVAHQKMSPEFKLSSTPSLLRKNSSGRRAKHHPTAGRTSSTGDLRQPRYNLRSRIRTCLKEGEEDGFGRAARSTGNFCTPLTRAPSNPTRSSLRNETWDEAVTTSSGPKSAASFQPLDHAQRRGVNLNENRSSDCSKSLPRPKDKNVRLKPAIVLDPAARSKAKSIKHVHFADRDNEISYEVTKDDIKNSWLDVDVSSALESTIDRNQDMTVSFGPTGRFTLLDMDLCKNGKDYMVLMQQNRLVNEMLGQRNEYRRAVLEEQARQKREGVVDPEKLHAVASSHSKWGVEITKSSWWLHMTNMS